MNALINPRSWLALGLAGFALLIGVSGWYWFVERTEVPPGKFIVLVHCWGKDLPENEIVAPDPSYKGVQLEVLSEGRHFINPIFWERRMEDMVEVPTNQCLVLWHFYGKDIPKERRAEGDFLAREGEKGLLRDVLPPGKYRRNRYAEEWKLYPAVEIRADQVGVRTLKVGKDPNELQDKVDLGKGLYVVPAGYRGVQKDPVPAGTYYINPFVESITPVEVRSHRVELKDISFPSRDGFTLKPRVIVEYAVNYEKAPELLVRLTDEGKLHQEDGTQAQQEHNVILQKVILPLIRGSARIEGSNFDAKDFVITAQGKPDEKTHNNREKLQRALEEKVRPKCQELGIIVRAVSLAEMKPPDELTNLISERDQARVFQQKNLSKVGEYKSEQKLRAQEAETLRAQVMTDAETKLKQEETRALQRKEVEEQRLKVELENAQLKLDAARKQAEAILAKGKADAAVINLQNDAEVAGLRKAVQGFNGIQNFAQYHILSRLAPALTEVFASEDSDFAKLLTAYLNPPAAMSKAAASQPAAPAEAPGSDKVTR